MRKKVILIAGVALLALAITMQAALANGWGRGPKGAYSGYEPRVSHWEELKLTPEQLEKLTALRRAHLEKTAKLRAELQSKMLELQTLMLQPSPEADKVSAKIEEIGSLRTQLQKEALASQLEMRKVLTPEQLNKLLAYRGFGPRGWGYGPGKEGRMPGRGRCHF